MESAVTDLVHIIDADFVPGTSHDDFVREVGPYLPPLGTRDKKLALVVPARLILPLTLFLLPPSSVSPCAPSHHPAAVSRWTRSRATEFWSQ